MYPHMHAVSQSTNAMTSFCLVLFVAFYPVHVHLSCIVRVMQRQHATHGKAPVPVVLARRHTLFPSLPSPSLHCLVPALPSYTLCCCLQDGHQVIGDSHEHVVILFSDIVGFSTMASTMSAVEVFLMLSNLYYAFDRLVDKFGIYKVETIGDGYMLAAGKPSSLCF